MPRKPFVTDEWIIELYNNNMPMTELSKQTGLTDRAIRNVIKNHGISRRAIGQPRKHHVNEHFFKTWTHEMAWVLGMIYTDGCLHKNSYSLTIAQKDETILKKLAQTMEAEYIINKNDTPSLIINSKIIYNDLLALGLTPSKSKILTWPEVPERYLYDFVRGVIDGDGWIQERGYVMNITTASKSFAHSLHEVLLNWHLNSEIIIYKTPANTDVYRVWVKGKESINALANKLYNEKTSLYNPDKKKRLEKWSDG